MDSFNFGRRRFSTAIVIMMAVIAPAMSCNIATPFAGIPTTRNSFKSRSLGS
jgi:hypothetical protein